MQIIKKFLYKTIPFFILIAFTHCAPDVTRKGYYAPPRKVSDCEIQILKNEIDLESKYKKIGTIIVGDNSYGVNCSENDVIALIKNDGCHIGAKIINMYNFNKPDPWASGCFVTYADFFTDSLITKSHSQLYITDTIKNTGFELLLSCSVGPLLKGNQTKTNLEPSPSGYTKYALGINARYFKNKLGAEFDYQFLKSTNGSNKGFEDISLYDETTFRLCFIGTAVQAQMPDVLIRIIGKLGLNYDLLTLDNEYSKLLTPHFDLFPGSGKGIGWLAGLNMDFVTQNRLVFGIGVEYEYVNPKFDDAEVSIDGYSVNIPFYFGYKF
ncbi:MAG: hypothetical protein JNL74_02190 [Fibrobacteres bacterium]|nr:hypothetical protein [Fibrobacterota bacterium]